MGYIYFALQHAAYSLLSFEDFCWLVSHSHAGLGDLHMRLLGWIHLFGLACLWVSWEVPLSQGLSIHLAMRPALCPYLFYCPLLGGIMLWL